MLFFSTEKKGKFPKSAKGTIISPVVFISLILVLFTLLFVTTYFDAPNSWIFYLLVIAGYIGPPIFIIVNYVIKGRYYYIGNIVVFLLNAILYGFMIYANIDETVHITESFDLHTLFNVTVPMSIVKTYIGVFTFIPFVLVVIEEIRAKKEKETYKELNEKLKQENEALKLENRKLRINNTKR